MKKLIAGNWKMNCSLDEAKTLIADVINGIYQDQGLQDTCDFVVLPPYIYLPTVRHALANHSFLEFGAQDCSVHENGAHTGDISAAMLKDSACNYVTVGHSERRQNHGETNDVVKAKAGQAHKNGMTAIICVGETLTEREAGQEEAVVQQQVMESLPASANPRNTVIAYEPVWAIGTGKVAGNAEIRNMHSFIRALVEEKLADGGELRILYGGSVKPDNAAEILKIRDVDGALVGGASLKAVDFLGIGSSVKS